MAKLGYRPERLEATIRGVMHRAGQPFREDSAPAQEIERQVLANHVRELGVETTRRIVELFAETMQAGLAEAKYALQVNSTAQFTRVMHRMKSSALTLGLRQLAEIAAGIEAQSDTGPDARRPELLAEFEQVLPQASAALILAWENEQKKHHESGTGMAEAKGKR